MSDDDIKSSVVIDGAYTYSRMDEPRTYGFNIKLDMKPHISKADRFIENDDEARSKAMRMVSEVCNDLADLLADKGYNISLLKINADCSKEYEV